MCAPPGESSTLKKEDREVDSWNTLMIYTIHFHFTKNGFSLRGKNIDGDGDVCVDVFFHSLCHGCL